MGDDVGEDLEGEDRVGIRRSWGLFVGLFLV